MFGDWGLGIGDWAQSPIPNPQSPKLNLHSFKNYIKVFIIYLNIIEIKKCNNNFINNSFYEQLSCDQILHTHFCKSTSIENS